MEKISQTALKTFLSCPRKYWFCYKLNLRSKEKSHALQDGSTLHDAVEKYYLYDRTEKPNHPCFRYVDWGFPEAKLPFLSNIFDLLREQDLSNDRYSRLLGMYAGYVKKWDKKEFASYRPEEELKFEWRGVIIHCRLDNVITLLNGSKRLMEIKTTSEELKDRADRIADDIQALFYLWAYYIVTGEKLDGVFFRIVKKTKLRQRFGESEQGFSDRIIKEYIFNTDQYLSETFVSKNDDDLVWFQEELIQHIEDMSRERKIWVRNTQRCFDYGGCEYYPLCNEQEINPNTVEDLFSKNERKT